jgi:hypothetical protein
MFILDGEPMSPEEIADYLNGDKIKPIEENRLQLTVIGYDSIPGRIKNNLVSFNDKELPDVCSFFMIKIPIYKEDIMDILHRIDVDETMNYKEYRIIGLGYDLYYNLVKQCQNSQLYYKNPNESVSLDRLLSISLSSGRKSLYPTNKKQEITLMYDRFADSL